MANITRFDPFADQLSDLFEGLFVRPVRFDPNGGEQLSMKIDVTQNDKAYTVKADMPGAKKEDIHEKIACTDAGSSRRRSMKNHGATERALHVAVTPEQRYHMINDVAYFRALTHRQETRDPADSWCEVEAEIDAILKDRHAR